MLAMSQEMVVGTPAAELRGINNKFVVRNLILWVGDAGGGWLGSSLTQGPSHSCQMSARDIQDSSLMWLTAGPGHWLGAWLVLTRVPVHDSLRVVGCLMWQAASSRGDVPK